MTYRLRPLSLAAIALVLAWALPALAQNEEKRGERDKAPAADQFMVFQGRIASVDTSNRDVVLNEARPWTGVGVPPRGPGDRPPAGGERPPAGDRPPTAPPDRPPAPPAPPGPGGVGTPDRAGHTMTFHLTDNASVTIDGKKADFRDLKKDMWARVRVGAKAGDKSAPPGEKGAGDKGAGERPVVLQADRIEAFTKAPASGGPGAPPVPERP